MYLGQIEPAFPSGAIDKETWVQLIDSHPQLRRHPPRTGINPFTRKPMEVTPPPTSARITVNDNDIGSLSWAMDDSPCLVVKANDGYAEPVARIAELIAVSLKGTFVLEPE